MYRYLPFLLVLTLAIAQEPTIVRVYFDDPVTARETMSRLAAWQVDYEEGWFLVGVTAEERAVLEAEGYRVTLDEKQTRANRQRAPLKGQTRGIGGFPCYRTVEETLDLITQFALTYPDLASWEEIGVSWERDQDAGNGYPITVLKLTNTNIAGPKPILFAMSAMHAREYTTAELNTRFAEYLLAAYDTDPDATWLLDHREIHLVLQANPDGRVIAEGGSLWRKNTHVGCGAFNDRGVDLNRNFGYQWNCCGGSSGNPCSETYRGTSPYSEPESNAIHTYLTEIFPDQKGPNPGDPAPVDATGVFIDIHSFGNTILWPWGYDDLLPPNPGLASLGRKMAYENGYTPQQAIDLYAVDGATDDNAYGTLGVAAYTFELGTSFFESCESFEDNVLSGGLQALIYAAKAAEAPYMLSKGPDMVNVSTYFEGGSAILSAKADDGRRVDAAAQPIAEAVYSFNYPTTRGAGQPMTAVDGAFDQVAESVAATVDVSGLATGRYPIYFQARDSDGDWGALSSSWLFVPDPDTRFEGTVRREGTNTPLEATIETVGYQTTSGPDGSFSLALHPGSFDFTVSAPDHGTVTVTDVTLDEGATLVQDIFLPPICTVFADDVEAGAGDWTAEGSWSPSSEDSVSGVLAWNDSPGGDYGNDMDAALTSPVLDLSEASEVMLSFQHRYNLETDYDYGYVEVTTDGVFWTTVSDHNGIVGWHQETLDLPQLAGAAQARIRFRLETDGSVQWDGWQIDDIVITVPGACDDEGPSFDELLPAWPAITILELMGSL